MTTAELRSVKVPDDADRRFTNSPDAGDPECICSRCGEWINHAVIPLRVFGPGYEYRYHPRCLGLMIG